MHGLKDVNFDSFWPFVVFDLNWTIFSVDKSLFRVDSVSWWGGALYSVPVHVSEREYRVYT